MLEHCLSPFSPCGLPWDLSLFEPDLTRYKFYFYFTRHDTSPATLLTLPSYFPLQCLTALGTQNSYPVILYISFTSTGGVIWILFPWCSSPCHLRQFMPCWHSFHDRDLLRISRIKTLNTSMQIVAFYNVGFLKIYKRCYGMRDPCSLFHRT